MSTAARWTAIDLFFEMSLLGLLASGYFSVIGSGYVDAPTAVLTGCGLLARALIVTGKLELNLSNKLVNTLTIGYTAFYAIDYFYLSREFLTATVHLVFFLAIVKILTASTDRDYLYVKIIAFLELLAASILSADANYFLFLTLFLLFGVANFASGEIRRSAARADNIVRAGQRRFGWRLAGITVAAVSGILILTAGLFFLLPRTAHAAFQRFIPQRYHLPGFSNEVSLGQIGELKSRSTAVMHVKILQDHHPPALKWRGAALTEFDGKRWFNKSNTAEVLKVENGLLRLATLEETLRTRQRIDYEVVMQEVTSDALFLAGVPESIRISVPLVIRTPSDAYRLGFGPPDRLRYYASCVLDRDHDPRYRGEELNFDLRQSALQLPNLDPRVRQRALDLTQGLTSSLAKAHKLEEHLRTAYGYTTELPAREVADPVADFLFQRKKGHCEYFSAALAVMLRSIGIPSRVVTGFQSGMFNPLSGWYLIRASDAHSWVEGWMEGRGWVTLDPTPPDPNPPHVTLSTRMQLYLDAMQVFWQDWVLSYDLDRQLILASRMEQQSQNLQLRWLERFIDQSGRQLKANVSKAKEYGWKIVAGVCLVAGLVLLIPALWRRWKALERVRRVQRGDVSPSDATVLYERMLEILRTRGIEKPMWITPREFANVIPDPQSALVGEFTAAYNELRFGMRKDAASKMVGLLERMEKL